MVRRADYDGSAIKRDIVGNGQAARARLDDAGSYTINGAPSEGSYNDGKLRTQDVHAHDFGWKIIGDGVDTLAVQAVIVHGDENAALYTYSGDYIFDSGLTLQAATRPSMSRSRRSSSASTRRKAISRSSRS